MMWYHNHFSKVVKSQNVNGSGASTNTGALADFLDKSKPPRRRRPEQCYMKLYYQERIKPVFDPLWEKISSTPVAAGEREPSMLNEKNRLAKRLYDEEPDEFKATIQEMVEAEYQEALKAHKGKTAVPRTANEFHAYVSNHICCPAGADCQNFSAVRLSVRHRTSNPSRMISTK